MKNNSMHFFNNDSKWNQWFAGLVDGDGCFYFNKKEKNISFELTTHTTDARVLYNIKNKLKAGSVKLRSGSNSIRYRVKQKQIIIDIVKRLNGRLYNPIRVNQLKQACGLYNIEYINAPALISKDNGYLSGLIDSKGTLDISISHSTAQHSQISGVEGRTIRLIHAGSHHQIYLKITSSNESYLKIIKNSYGYGTVYKENAKIKNRNPNDKFHWTLRSYDEFQILYEYVKKNAFKTQKMHRMRLALLYFKYKTLKYPLKPAGTIEAKIWTKFSKSWYKYSY